jgi:hypothetical protein
MWTSAKSILPPPHRRELCSILNSALFADDAVVVQHVAVITQVRQPLHLITLMIEGPLFIVLLLFLLQ